MGSSISIVASVTAVISAVGGCITFFVMMRRMWTEEGAEVSTKGDAKSKSAAEAVKVKERRRAVGGRAVFFYGKAAEQRSGKMGEELPRKGRVVRTISGMPIVLQSERGSPIDVLTRFDVYHHKKHKKEVERFVEKAAEWYGFYLVREERRQKLKERMDA